MRKLAVVLVSAMTVFVGWAPAHAAAAPRVVINHTASKIYQYDPSPDGTGVKQPATNVRATFYNCPAGDYQLNATLRQNGTTMSWATSGRGAGEFSCDGTTKKITINWPFTGKTLHAGKAHAAFSLNKVVCDDDTCTTQGAPTVRSRHVVHIPRGR